jgi:hypothetical protein
MAMAKTKKNGKETAPAFFTGKTRVRKSRKAVDVKAAAANDVQPEVQSAVGNNVATKEVSATPQPKAKSKNAKYNPARIMTVATGHELRKLAGNPTIPHQKRVFGSNGYSLSWVNRARRMGMEPDALAHLFASDPDKTKDAWEKAHDLHLHNLGRKEDE